MSTNFSKDLINTKNSFRIIGFITVLLSCLSCSKHQIIPVLDSNYFKNYIDDFNKNDIELYIQYIPNDSAFNFLAENIPIIEIPDKKNEETYYFRWWTFRKHLKNTEDGFVFSEFLPDVSWSGKHNTISCAAAHHIYEGRWLINPVFIEDYLDFWLNIAGDNKRRYSFWMADAAVAYRSVHPNDSLISKQLQYFIENYHDWEKLRKDPLQPLFWQFDAFDGMEFSASGRILNGGQPTIKVPAVRPSINSYMFGEAKAISAMAKVVKRPATENLFNAKADSIKEYLQKLLWNRNLNFFSVLPRNYSDSDTPVNIRELIGYTPWYFYLPDDIREYASAWDCLIDTLGFSAPFGLTTCERSHPYFQISYTGWECQWNGPVWPYATTVTLKALSNLLNNYLNKGIMSKYIFYDILLQYATSHFLINESGDTVKWIDESQNPFTGDWITRTRLKNWKDGAWPPKLGGLERGKDYNHSGFCDLVISDLLGIRPHIDGTFEINPLIPDSWEWFCVDNLLVQRKNISLIWDKTGKKYNRGKGLSVFIDGKLVAKSNKIEKLKIDDINKIKSD